MAWAFLWGPLMALAAMCLLCVIYLPKAERPGLMPLSAVMLTLAAALFGGVWLLGWQGLTYRTWLKEGLSAALWAVGLTTGVLTVRFFYRLLEKRCPKLAPWGMALALLCLLNALWMGTMLGGLWAIGPNEQTITYQGQTVVQCTDAFLGNYYELYEYHGPLVRGSRCLVWEEGPFAAEP